MASTVNRWTGRETKLLREALRMSQRQFAEHLGVSDRAVTKWEAGATTYRPRAETQALLDTALNRATSEERERFHASGGRSAHREGRPREGLRVDSHKFVPVFIGHYQVQRLARRLGLADPRAVLDANATPVDHPTAERCTLHVHPCGVAVFHILEPRQAASLAELAVWRYRTYLADLEWAAGVLAGLLATDLSTEVTPSYVFSAYWLHSAPWPNEVLDSALELVATPSPLVDRSGSAGIVSLGPDNEHSLLASGFTHPDVLPIGVPQIAAGYVGWSGISYLPLAPERALASNEIIALEVLVQTMWCYATHIQLAVENGRDPQVPDKFGWRFLRAAHSRLTNARPLETSQHCLMREAVVKTSGVTEILRAAQASLRDEER